MTSTRTAAPVSDEWPVQLLDRTATPGWSLSDSMSRLRSWCPGAHGPRHGDFWIVTDRDDVEWVARDWGTFAALPVPSIPCPDRAATDIAASDVDTSIRIAFHRLVDDRPTSVDADALTGNARDVAARLLDGIVGRDGGDVVGEFVRPYVGTTLFALVLDAPAEDVEWLTTATTRATGDPGANRAWADVTTWMDGFLTIRESRSARRHGVHRLPVTRVDGRPAASGDVLEGMQLLVLGWLETLGDALSRMIRRLCEHPLVLRRLRERPDLVPAAMDGLLRTDAPTVSMARTVTRDVEIGGHRLVRGERVLACLPSSDRDATPLLSEDWTADGHPPEHRPVGAGLSPHRCVLPDMAHMSLLVALEAIVSRVDDVPLGPMSQSPINREEGGQWVLPRMST